jgi:hypothetical protein
MLRRWVGCLTAALLVLAPGEAAAWNSVGHMAVGKLAHDQLTDGQKRALFALLQSHPHFQKYLAAGRPADVSEVEWAIVRAGVWPDWVRPRKQDSRGADVTRYHRGEDHYVNIPLIEPRDQEAFAGKTLIDPDLNNILCALKARCGEMLTKTARAEDKAVAVCWIFHLIGDIHQPLHNVAYFSSDKAFVGGDMGGNLFGVRVAGRKTGLHAYWDNLLGDDPGYADDSPEHQARTYQQAMKAAALLRNLKLPAAEEARLAQNKTFASWSQESFELAKSVAYQKPDGSGILDRVPVKFNSPLPDDAPEAGDAYHRAARAVAEVRIVLAGRRLAERIRALLGK